MSRAGIAAAAVALVALSALAPTPAAAVEPTVDEIVAKHLEARGGLKRIRAVQRLVQQGRASAGAGREALVKRELARPAKTRFELTVQGVTSVLVSDGEKGWVTSPLDGQFTPTPLPAEVVADAVEQADLDGPLVDWKAKGHRVELEGREVVNGREAHVLKITLASGAVRRDLLDVKSHHLVRSVSTRRFRGRPVQVTTTFGDFRKTKGLVFPRSIEVEAAGRPNRLRVIVDEIEVDSALPPG
jgi:outer membrane lipoprotein-sorting protein